MCPNQLRALVDAVMRWRPPAGTLNWTLVIGKPAGSMTVVFTRWDGLCGTFPVPPEADPETIGEKLGTAADALLAYDASPSQCPACASLPDMIDAEAAFRAAIEAITGGETE